MTKKKQSLSFMIKYVMPKYDKYITCKNFCDGKMETNGATQAMA